jgi:hypothetical protein
VTAVGAQHWGAPAGQPGPAIAFSLVGWWLVSWRARVLDDSAGNVDARLAAVADALGRLDIVGGLPGVHLVGQSGVVFEFWFEAAGTREAAGGARVALRQACKAAGVGDPTPLPGVRADVMLMFEELPTLHRDEPTGSSGR